MSNDKPLLALDLGGTKIVTALVASNGDILGQEYVLTLAEEGVEAVISRMLATIDHVLSMAGPAATGGKADSLTIAAAGAIDSEKGIVTASPNLPGWIDVPLQEMMQEAIQMKTYLVNDASAAALGEHRFGAGKGCKHLVYLTVSTGIGGGIVVEDKLYLGASGSAGEIGHMTIDIDGPRCKCGSNGCLEMLASGMAVAREAQRLVAQGVTTRIMKLADGEPTNITAKVVGEAARQGDTVAREILDRAATCLGVGLANVINIFNPEIIVIGGGMSRMGEMLLEPARRAASERTFRLPFQRTSIVRSELGDDAALLGGTAFARDEAKKKQNGLKS